MLLQLKPLGCDGNSQPSVPAWLDSLGLQDYVQSFLSSGYSSIDTVKNLWELEIVNVSVAVLLPWQPGPARGPAGLGLAGTGVRGALGCSKSRDFAPCPGQEASSEPVLSLQVLKVNLLGHRKRIIASLADRPYEEPPAKPPRFSQLRVSPWWSLLRLLPSALALLHLPSFFSKS